VEIKIIKLQAVERPCRNFWEIFNKNFIFKDFKFKINFKKFKIIEKN
jgi:hypothetical protein